MTIYSLFAWDEVAGLVGLLKQPAHPASASPAISASHFRKILSFHCT
jgi:hypothetical protein